MYDNSSNYNISYQNHSVAKGFYDASISQLENQTTNPGVNATYELNITNTGNFTGTFTLAVTNHNDADVAALNKTEIVNLASSASQNVTLNVTDAGAGRYNVTVNVTSTDTGGEVASTSYIMTTVVGPTLTLGNVTGITSDWGRDFYVNHSVTARNASANNVRLNYSCWLENASWGSIAEDSTEWKNQSVSNNIYAVATNSILVHANATDANNVSATFWLNITARDVTATIISSSQAVNVSETFSVNASAIDNYGDDFTGNASLLKEGTLVKTQTGITKYANFSTNVSESGTYNFSVLFYNTSHYYNATSDSTTVTVSGPVLELGNVTDITCDWGRDFCVNHSVTATNATANNVTLNYSFWLENASWDSITKGSTVWKNQSVSNNTVSNNSILVYANATDTKNAPTTFWLNVTARDVNATMISPDQAVNVNETFNVNASAVDEHGDEFIGNASLLKEGSIIANKTITDGTANFSTNESAAGTYNFSIKFHNTTYYINESTSNSSVTVSRLIPPSITSFAPESSVNDTYCTWRTFNVTVNQTVNVTWYLNGTPQTPMNESVTEANFSVHAEVVGEHNVSAVAENANGTDMQTWIWNVTAPNQPPIASFIYTPVRPAVNQILAFNASNSSDPDGTITNYEWDFGDGTNGIGVTVNHSYSSAGSYTVILTVTDADGAKNSSTSSFEVVNPTGGMSIVILPKIKDANAGAPCNFTIRIRNTQNFDELVNIEVTLSGLPSQYQANLTWFNWSSSSSSIPAGEYRDIGLKLDIPDEISGYKYFSIIAHGTFGDSKDYGGVNVK